MWCPAAPLKVRLRVTLIVIQRFLQVQFRNKGGATSVLAQLFRTTGLRWLGIAIFSISSGAICIGRIAQAVETYDYATIDKIELVAMPHHGLDLSGAEHQRGQNPYAAEEALLKIFPTIRHLGRSQRRQCVIKSDEELTCMRWAIAVAELAVGKVRSALRPGVTELELWAQLNYWNIANDGDWHDGRVLVSGPRTNPWCQEASGRRLESGDLVGLDTDMIGPFGYFADISRTFHCGPAPPTRAQKELYRRAVEEIEFNLGLVRPGISLRQFQARAYPVEERFQRNAYPCVIHGVGMCDEYPRVNPVFRGSNPYDGVLEENMVICVESYVGEAGGRDGVKLEQQVLVTRDGCELLTRFPLEETLLD